MPRSVPAAAALALLAACGGGGDGGAGPVPSIAAVSPAGGPLAGGTDVVVTGSGFGAGAVVRFGAAAAAFTVVAGSSEIHARTPAHAAGPVAVSVENPGGRTATLPDAFTYLLPPVAIAPLALRAPPGTPVDLDGTLSSDPFGLPVPLAWRWTVSSGPAGSAATLSDAASPVATFTPDVAGSYAVALVVTGLGGASAPATTVVETLATGSRVPDSGQAACYDDADRIPCPAAGSARFGQDAQYAIQPVAFSPDAATVTDPVTGLVWQRIAGSAVHNWWEATGTFDPAYNDTPAVSVCGDLADGGHADWRLPSRRELFTLLRFVPSPGQPLANLLAFPEMQLGPYWTSTDPPPGVGVPWAVDFQFGTATYGFGGRESGLYVRCVRGPRWGESAFVDQGDGTVRDDGTGLVWERSPVQAQAWAGALARCEGLSLAGGGWRLPSAMEMDAFIDGSRWALPAVDPALFPTTPRDGRYWTSTTAPWLASEAYLGDLAYGALSHADKGTSIFVRCVR